MSNDIKMQSPSVYNPRDRSPIKAPEHKVCVTCGQPIAPDVQPFATHMNQYVNPVSEIEFTISSDKKDIEVGGVKLIRKDIYLAAKEGRSLPPASTSPILTHKPVEVVKPVATVVAPPIKTP